MESREPVNCTRPILALVLLAASGCTSARETDSEFFGPEGDSAVWRLDRIDTLGGLPATVLGAPQLIETPDGAAVAFDGVDDALLLDTHPLIGLKEFTVEVVFRPDVDGAKEQRFFHMQSATNDDRILFETRLTGDGHWFLDTFIRSGDQSLTLYAEDFIHPTGRWYHAAITVDDAHFRHFVDGKLELETPITYTPQPAGRLSLGVRINRVHWFKGAVRAIRFTPRALSIQEVAKLSPP